MKTYIWHKNNVALDSPDTIHHILAYGTINDTKEIQEILGKDRVLELFLKYPKNIYSKKSFFFVKNYLLKTDKETNDEKYFKTTPRNIRQR